MGCVFCQPLSIIDFVPVHNLLINIFQKTVSQSNDFRNYGQVTESSLPYKQGETALKKVFSYDMYGRPILESSDAGTVSYRYSGRTTQVTSASGQGSSKTVDSQGNVITATDNGGSVSYSYKSLGKPGSITTNSSTTSMVYDSYGRQTSLSEPNAGTTSYRYNNFGELTKQTDAKGKVDSLAYDLLGRVTTEVRSEGTKTYTYDPSGNPGLMSSVSYPGGSENYFYDSYGRLESKIIDIGGTHYTTDYAYDSYSRLRTVDYPSGFVVKNVYNTFGYLDEVRRNDNNALIWDGISTNAFGQFTQYQYGNNLTTTKTYDALGMLRGITTGNVQNLGYSFDPATGNLLSRRDNLRGLTEVFGYDNLDRLTSVSGPAPVTMTYASNGNIQSKTSVGSYTYGTKPHALTSVTNPDDLIPSTEQRISYTFLTRL